MKPIMELVNLTPHELVVFDGDKVSLRVPVSGPTARIVEIREARDALLLGGVEIPLVELSYSRDVENLPASRDNTTYVVSRVTAQALAHRADLVFPIDEVRDTRGRIIGCRGLGRFGDAAWPRGG